MLNKTLHTKSLSTYPMIRLDWNSDASKIEKDGACMYVWSSIKKKSDRRRSQNLMREKQRKWEVLDEEDDER